MAMQDETIVVASAADDTRSYVDWPAIFAGTVLATAISFVMLTFGSALGLSLTSAYEGEGASLMWFAIAAGLWLLWVQVSASIVGGYLAGRMRRRHGDATEEESDMRDGSHGLVVWGLSTLVAATIVYSGAMGAASVAGQAAGAATSAAATTIDTLDGSDLLVDRALRGGEPVGDETRAEIGRILITAATTEEGLDAGDRDYLVGVVAQRAAQPFETDRRGINSA